MDLGVDGLVPLDVSVAGQSDPPIGLGVVVLALLRLAVVQHFAVIVLIPNLPVEVVVRDVRVVDVLLAVRVGGGDSGESNENQCNLPI